MKRYILKIIDSVIALFCVVVFLFAAIVIIAVMKTPEGEPPMIFGRTMFQVVSPSMEPALRLGTVVIVEQVDPTEVEVGDIISFYSRDPDIYNSIVTHRVDGIKQKDDGVVFYTKGDANPARDKLSVKGNQFIGKVTDVSNILGSFVMLLSYKGVFALLILVPMGYIFISNGYKFVKSVKRNKKKKAENEEADKEKEE